MQRPRPFLQTFCILLVAACTASAQETQAKIAVLQDAYEVRVFDATGKQLSKFRTGSKADAVAISRDGSRLVVLRDRYEAKVFDGEGKSLSKFRTGSKA